MCDINHLVIIVWRVTVNMSELMKNIYFNRSSSGALGGKNRLKQAVLQEHGVKLNDKDVTAWLASQDPDTLH